MTQTCFPRAGGNENWATLGESVLGPHGVGTCFTPVGLPTRLPTLGAPRSHLTGLKERPQKQPHQWRGVAGASELEGLRLNSTLLITGWPQAS